MVDEEVENILLEIRERVRARELPAPAIPDSAMGNGAGESSLASREAAETSATEALERIDSYLTITSRAWDRLPPLVSNRSGGIARLELWVKRQIIGVTHWFTWEQINFNAAVHHALQDTLQALSNYEQALETLRAEFENQRTILEQVHATLEAQRVAMEAQRVVMEKQRMAIETQRVAIETQRVTMEAQRATLETQLAARVVAQKKELDGQLSELAREMQTRVEHVQDEQRVCFKQLSLEATEASVLEDRARRKTETLLDELKCRVEQIEKSDE